jgi:uncharacterized protein (DUF1330 family)
MAAYGIGILNNVEMGPQIVEYLERIDATLAPFEGRFVVHGAQPKMREGASPGTVVVIEFPDPARADGWYASPAYQEIIHLRADHSDSVIFIIDGCDADHVATDVLRAAG